MNNITATDSYFHIDSKDVCQRAEEVLTNMGLDFEMAYSKKFGSTTHQVVYNLKDLYIPSEKDKGLLPRIMFTNSYNKESAFVIAVGLLRGICSNGLVFGQSFFNEKIIHRAGPTAEQKIAQVAGQVERAIEVVAEMPDHIDEMKSIRFTDNDWIEIVGNLKVPDYTKQRAWNAKLRGSLRDYESENNAWNLYNVVNETMRLTATPIQYTKANKGLMDDVVFLSENLIKVA